MLWGAFSRPDPVTSEEGEQECRKIVSFKTIPASQAAAAAYMSVDVTYTLEDEDVDASSDRATEAITGCYAAMGISEKSPWADEVAEAVRELGDKMRAVLVKAGLLRSDCAEAWQALKVA
jgi:hypothetical protein